MKLNQVDLNQLRDDVHRNLLKLRAIENILGTDKFARMWNLSDEKLKGEARKYISNIDRRGLVLWMRLHPTTATKDLSTSALRIRGKALQVPYWSRLSKPHLIEGIEKAERKLDEIEASFIRRDEPNAGGYAIPDGQSPSEE